MVAQKNGQLAINTLPRTTAYFIEALNELAGTCFELQNMKLANKYFSQAFQQAENSSDILGKAAASNGLGAIAVSQGKTREAQKHFIKSLEFKLALN